MRLAAAALCAALAAAPVFAQDLGTDVTQRGNQVRAGLAALGLATTPPAYNALVFLERALPDDYGFISGQLGAWGTPVEGSQFYLEGFGSFQRYNPDFAFEGLPPGETEDVRWTSVSGTVGAGWEFRLTEHLAFRPIVNAAIGYITSDSVIPLVDDGAESDIDFIAGNSVEAVGAGASLMLDYNQFFGVYQVEARLRHSRMHQVALGESEESDTIVTSSIARLRQPIRGVRLAGRPVRSVSEITYARYDGDTGDILDLPWIVRVGTGLEFETGLERRFYPVRVRTMVRYVFGENFDGVGFGAGLIF